MVIGFRIRIIRLVVVHKIGIFLGGSSDEDHLAISISLPINSIYLIVESGVGNESNIGRSNNCEWCDA